MTIGFMAECVYVLFIGGLFLITYLAVCTPLYILERIKEKRAGLR